MVDADAYIGNEPGKVKIKFNQGGTIVEGFVTSVKNPMMLYAKVEGGEEILVRLAPSASELALDTEGMGTIEGVDSDGKAVNVSRFEGDVVILTDGRIGLWQNSPEGLRVPARRTTTVTIATL